MGHIHTEEKDLLLFNRIAKSYAEKDIVKSSSCPRKYQLMFLVEPVLKKLLHIDTIVEIACGLGASSKYLAGNYRNYVGIDYSERLIEKARLFSKDNKRVKFIAANVKNIPADQIQAHCGDVILAVGALHHMTELDLVMKSLQGLAKPGAYFLAIEPSCGNPIVQAMRWIRGRVDASYSKEQKFFSKKELRQLLEASKLRDVEIVYQGFFTPPFAQIILHPQIISVPLSKLAVLLDKTLDKILPNSLKFLSWNIAIRARFPSQ